MGVSEFVVFAENGFASRDRGKTVFLCSMGSTVVCEPQLPAKAVRNNINNAKSPFFCIPRITFFDYKKV